jgi:hypothetical protein
MAVMALALGLSASACTEDPGSFSPGIMCNCSDGDPCTDDRCIGDGECLHVPAASALACLDDHHCNEASSCQSGTCEPFLGCGFLRCTVAPRVCDDGDDCTLDRCEPGTGCVFDRLDETACSADSDCDDNSGCTDDVCVDFPGCGRFCAHRPNDCLPCEAATDCGAPCQVSTCVEGACVYEPADRFCDYQCFAPITVHVDVGGGMAPRGLAQPIDTDCDGCRCERELVLAGQDQHLTLRIDGVDGPPWGTCEVDVCGGTTTCAPLHAGRGYMLRGPWMQADRVVNGELLGPFTMGVDYACLAVHSELMLGLWRMTLELEGGPATRFEAVVKTADAPTRFEITATTDGIGIPAQTMLLPSGAFRLRTRLETNLGPFEGDVFSGPTAIAGDLVGPEGQRAVLRIELP